jgi:tRNA (guanine10-N2)-dimethyltransferase
MKLLFELSKEHKTLPGAEACATLEAEHIPYQVIDSNQDVLVVEIKPNDPVVRRLAERLAYTFVIDELLFSCPASLDEMVRCAEKHTLPDDGSIAIRCKNRSSSLQSADVIDRLGDVYTKNRSVNLSHPEIELRVVITGDRAYIGIQKAALDTSHFQKRRGHFRPFLQPITLHPKVARGLVNLSAVNTHETLLDPFCGTGGILLEAGLLGIHVIGSDIEKKMIDGCRKNLEFYHLKDFTLFCADIGDIPKLIHSVDAVVTDFPYARATTTKGEQLTQLYDRAFQTISQILKKNGRAVIGLSSKDILDGGKKHLSVVETYPMKSHRSLTRYFVVYTNG